VSTKYLGEKLTREIVVAILNLIKDASRYTSKEVIAILASDYPPSQTRTILYRLKDQESIGGGAYGGYHITAKGIHKLERLKIKPLTQQTNWDGKWRMIIYDIPEDQRRARHLVRALIKQLGFRKLQQSVWVHPLPCFEEFEKIRDAYGIKEHILLLEVENSEIFENLTTHFHLHNID